MIPSDLPGLIGGKYRPLGVIGEGAMGIVYSVEHISTGEQLALKVMTAHHGATREAIERFKREARASAKIKSEHVVRIIDADVAPELDRAPYLVMDLLDGVDLEKASCDGALAATVVIDWLRQIARALDKAHKIGITHRDLKPENLFLSHREDGTPLIKILDFGIAKIAAESTGTTQSGQILGTPLYMAPEQARGDPTMIGPSADLYALGLIAYKLLRGEPYWNATSVAGIIGQVLYEPMTAPSERGSTLGQDFDAWFLRACNRKREERYGTAVEEVEALAKALGLPVDPRAEALKSNPEASGSRLAGLASPGASPVMAVGSSSSGKGASEEVGQSGGTLVSSSSEKFPEVRVMTLPRRHNALVFAIVSAAVLLSMGVILFYRQDPSPPPAAAAPAIAAKAVAAPTEVLAPAFPPLAQTALAIPAASAAASTELAAGAKAAPPVQAAVTAADKTRRKESPKPPPARSAPTAAPSEKRFANDPLGDQK